MKYPVYIPWFEPRVRRRWWSDIRRAKALAVEALTPNLPERFYMTINDAHPNNPNNKGHNLYLVGHAKGHITFLETTSSAI